MTGKKSVHIEDSIIIDDISSFNKWRTELRKFRPGGTSKHLSFNLAKLPSSENEHLSIIANSYNQECGCNSGSFFMTFVVFITVTGYFITGGKFSSIGFHELGWLAGITILAAIAGKIFGLLRARWKLIKLSNNLNEKLTGEKPEKSIVTNH
jgi:hypothetical protein